MVERTTTSCNNIGYFTIVNFNQTYFQMILNRIFFRTSNQFNKTLHVYIYHWKPTVKAWSFFHQKTDAKKGHHTKMAQFLAIIPLFKLYTCNFLQVQPCKMYYMMAFGFE